MALFWRSGGLRWVEHIHTVFVSRRNVGPRLPFTFVQGRKGQSMRNIAVIALTLVAGPVAFARAAPPSNFPVERPGVTSAEELKKKVEEVGFKDVEIVPQMFVVLAKKPDGRGVSLIDDAQTMQALQLGEEDSGAGDDHSNATPDGACQGPTGHSL